MISLENAKRLTELGVKPYWQICGLDKFVLLNAVDGDMIFPLSQLLEEVEKRGRRLWQLYVDLIEWEDEQGTPIEDPVSWYVFQTGRHRDHHVHSATSPEDAVALALISILENLEETNND